MLQNTADNRFKLKRLLCIPESDVQRTHAKKTNFQKTMHSFVVDRLSKTMFLWEVLDMVTQAHILPTSTHGI